MFINAYKRAFEVILKKPFTLWGLSLMGGLISVISFYVCGLVPAIAIAVGFLISAGMAKIYLDGLKGLEVTSEQLFAGFNKSAGRIVGALAWQALWIVIWFLIPIVGPIFAVIKSYSYRFVPYIIMTQPEVKATEALKVSMKMTDGKKLNMFLADFCIGAAVFVVFLILGLLTAIPFIGILFGLVLFVVSLVLTAFSNIFVGLYQATFYEDAVNESAPPAQEPEFYAEQPTFVQNDTVDFQ